MKFLGFTIFVKYLGVQMVACQDIPSEVKKQIFFLSCAFHHEEEGKKKNTGRASFEISEAAYSTGYGKLEKPFQIPCCMM